MSSAMYEGFVLGLLGASVFREKLHVGYYHVVAGRATITA